MAAIPLRIITLNEVQKHNKPTDLWMIIHDKVYDVTKFCHQHPGGVEVLIDCGGQDATEAFRDVGHSDYALTMLNPYILGEINNNKPSETKSFDDVKNNNKEEGTKMGLLLPRFSIYHINIFIIILLIICIIIIQLIKWGNL
ncbi:unnamed protein product [Candida verbasci]|uniref:Cytochrome b5 heme-binding domain-containing protein n=1 Tax=Candida verbasci TaxID=1227364 RepID=A0A9W4TXU2_9ASCO|nr:unnamed protein product [Candida verbasci]